VIDLSPVKESIVNPEPEDIDQEEAEIVVE